MSFWSVMEGKPLRRASKWPRLSLSVVALLCATRKWRQDRRILFCAHLLRNGHFKLEGLVPFFFVIKSRDYRPPSWHWLDHGGMVGSSSWSWPQVPAQWLINTANSFHQFREWWERQGFQKYSIFFYQAVEANVDKHFFFYWLGAI